MRARSIYSLVRARRGIIAGKSGGIISRYAKLLATARPSCKICSNVRDKCRQKNQPSVIMSRKRATCLTRQFKRCKWEFILLISPHLIRPYLNWPHFNWSECVVIGRSHGELGATLLSDPVSRGCDRDRSSLTSDKMSSVEIRWGEVRWLTRVVALLQYKVSIVKITKKEE